LFNGITFANPWFLTLLVVVPLLLYRSLKSFGKSNTTLMLPSENDNVPAAFSFRIAVLKFLPFLRTIAIIALIIALARPQSSYGVNAMDTEGIDIIMATDLSASMLLKDFEPNRIEAAKKIGIDFIRSRPADRIGLVVFAGESFTLCPLTLDHHMVINQLSKVTPDFLKDGTAIGMALATSVDRLRESHAKSKVAIILTDGVNNSGAIDPLTAAELAVKYHVKVYTIGVGSVNGEKLQLPGRGFISSDIDEDLLKNISRLTGGRYFRATDNEALANIYHEIDRMEKVKIQSKTVQVYTEIFFPWLMVAFLFTGLEFLIRFLIIKKL
jgi:Ca-activated chloride channel homolog